MKTILIVEDNEKNMKLARDILQAKGYATLEAVTGTEGVRLAIEHRPDLVLMDIQLPDINGIEAFERIRADAATAGVPVVAFTASVTTGDRSRIGDAGFDGFLSKPINLKEFVETVRRLAGEPDA
jgi:two-component system cell cycle response regulator DivK